MIALPAALAASGLASADSLFKMAAHRQGTLIAKPNRFGVGDIITVLVDETINASVKADTNTKKESEINAEAKAADNAFLVTPGPGGLNLLQKEELPNWQIEAENEHKARGQTTRKSTLSLSISCLIVEVLAGGTLRIEGTKEVTTNREDTTVCVSGLVRPRDIGPDNTIRSSQIANAVIRLKGKGPLWNNQRRGVFTKILDWFSPF